MWFRVAIVWTMMAAAITVAAAGDLSKRDFALIQGTLDTLNSLLQQLDTSILALNEDNIKIAGPALLQLAGAIQPNLMGSASRIAESNPLSLQETLNLNTARVAFGQNVNLTVSDLLKQKPLFDSANLSEQVAKEIQTVRDMSGQFFEVIQAKLDPAAPSELDQLSSALVIFDSVVSTFRDMPTTATGAQDGTGSCVCVVTCPAGSFFVSSG